VIGSKIHVSYGTLQNGSNEINSSIPSLFLLIVRNRAGEKNRRHTIKYKSPNQKLKRRRSELKRCKGTSLPPWGKIKRAKDK